MPDLLALSSPPRSSALEMCLSSTLNKSARVSVDDAGNACTGENSQLLSEWARSDELSPQVTRMGMGELSIVPGPRNNTLLIDVGGSGMPVVASTLPKNRHRFQGHTTSQEASVAGATVSLNTDDGPGCSQ